MSQETGYRSSSKGVNDIVSPAQSTNQETRILYEFGPYLLDPSERKLCRGDEIVALPPKAFDTLLLMVRNSGRLMEKGELIETLWPDSFVEEGSLSNSIFLLRKALGEDPQYIETVPKRGYRFVGAVRCLPDGVRGHQEEAKFLVSPPATVAAAAQALPALRAAPHLPPGGNCRAGFRKSVARGRILARAARLRILLQFWLFGPDGDR